MTSDITSDAATPIRGSAISPKLRASRKEAAETGSADQIPARRLFLALPSTSSFTS
jgi:hypothetical protein